MAWNPFSFDGFDENLPDLTTDNTIDNGIVTAETLADDDTDSELFKSYQLTKESSNPFAESDEILDDDDMVDEHCGKCGKDDVEECNGSKCKKECGSSKCKNEFDSILDDEEEEISPFEEANLIMMDLAEAVLDDGEDDLIADEVDDMTDDDDEEIDADVEGIDEIEADILDDEEDDLIDMAMDAEE